ncbi:cationic amino acid transporter 2-like [Octopus sinensis]|uniref:Cationic amino acid transporter 2-like n=1 Tax=Octopus sinensis TaxID=2607531 RepID=A0A7E6FP85_9MOLL|nr:cationic amino acid transporter 2-like [Octopus sinensis]
MSNGWKKLFRLKTLRKEDLERSDLARVLNVADLIFLSLGCTVGAGAYILTGKIALSVAGPSIVLSFLIAALSSLLAACCYAEFGGRIPRAGSAYTYTYITLGELLAFIVGWSLILEYAIGVASNVKALTTNFDSMVNGNISAYLKSVLPMKSYIFGSYPDFLAFSIVMLLTLILLFGVKESAIVNNVATGINLYVLCFIIICGFFKADFKNWTIKNEIASAYSAGKGGFFPYGVSGMFKGAATCFYAFVGFDTIATTGEEAQNPQTTIPLSILVSLLIITLLYVGVSAVVILMCPYYLVDPLTPLTKAFEYVGWGHYNIIIYIGIVCALSTSIFSSLFPLPRIVYTMANDGIIFKHFSTVSNKFKTPWLAVLVCGILAAIISTIFDLGQLIDMLSLATLLAYTLVSKSITVLRYRRVILQTSESIPTDTDDVSLGQDESSVFLRESIKSKFYRWFNPNSTLPTKSTEHVALIASVSLTFVVVVLICIVSLFEQKLLQIDPWVVVIVSLLSLVIIILLALIARQPQNQEHVHFKVPFVPVFSEVSASFNMFLVTKLPSSAWIRFGIWLVLGSLVYFGYGFRRSKESLREQNLVEDQASTSEGTPA